jgi:ribonucleoside-diphosphate reductase alpha chain
MLNFANDFASKIFKLRYAYDENETWEQACMRVAEHVARGEEDPKKFAKYTEEFYDELLDGRFMPGGRIWYGSGRNKAQLLNCFVLGGTPEDDSREGWGKLLHDSLIISGTGGGIGVNFSDIRPRGTPIVGTGGEATGSVSFMRIVNSVCEEIKAGGQRRSALMFCLNHDHPDIMEFLNAKLDLGQINNANISVVFMTEDPEDFFKKVKNNEDHDLVWKGKVVKTIKAKELWEKLVTNALKNGEPGILNFHLFNKMNNIPYARKLVATNPCGEIGLTTNGNCCLGAVVLPRFVKRDSKAKNTSDRFDWEGLHTTVARGIRFLDNVLTVNHYPIPETELEAKAIRRLGLGVMGLHDMLLMLGLKYSSEEGRNFVSKIMSFIKHAAYDTSTYLALEKGAFPEFDAQKVCNSGFVKTLKPSVRNKIRDYGLRNCAVMTIAPTGTTSIVQGVTSGIEPIFASAYNRKFQVTNEDGYRELKSEIVVHPLFEEFVNKDLDISHFENSEDISPADHFAMQVVCQEHVDNAISKTVNIPQDKYTSELLSELYMEFVPKLKGTTIYPVGSRKDAPLSPIATFEAFQLVKDKKVVQEEEALDTCVSGVCGL